MNFKRSIIAGSTIALFGAAGGAYGVSELGIYGKVPEATPIEISQEVIDSIGMTRLQSEQVIAGARIEHELAIMDLERASNEQIGWVWRLVNKATGVTVGVVLGVVSISTIAMGGIVLYRVVRSEYLARTKDDRELVLVEGGFYVSKSFLSNNPEKIMEFASFRAQLDARVKMEEAATRPQFPMLSSYTSNKTGTYSPSQTRSSTFSPSVAETVGNTTVEAPPAAPEAQQDASDEDFGTKYEAGVDDLSRAIGEALGGLADVSLLHRDDEGDTYAIRPQRVISSGRYVRVPANLILNSRADVAMALRVDLDRLTMCQAAGYVECIIKSGDLEWEPSPDEYGGNMFEK